MPTSRASPATAVEVAERLHSAAIHLLRLVRRADAASGVSAAQLSALSVLVFGGPRTLGRLAEAEQVRPPTMSRLVRTLEACGLASRGPAEGDRRAVRVQATEAGRQVLLAGRERRVTVLAARLAALEPRELDHLAAAAELLERLLREDG